MPPEFGALAGCVGRRRVVVRTLLVAIEAGNVDGDPVHDREVAVSDQCPIRGEENGRDSRIAWRGNPPDLRVEVVCSAREANLHRLFDRTGPVADDRLLTEAVPDDGQREWRTREGTLRGSAPIVADVLLVSVRRAGDRWASELDRVPERVRSGSVAAIDGARTVVCPLHRAANDDQLGGVEAGERQLQLEAHTRSRRREPGLGHARRIEDLQRRDGAGIVIGRVNHLVEAAEVPLAGVSAGRVALSGAGDRSQCSGPVDGELVPSGVRLNGEAGRVLPQPCADVGQIHGGAAVHRGGDRGAEVRDRIVAWARVTEVDHGLNADGACRRFFDEVGVRARAARRVDRDAARAG